MQLSAMLEMTHPRRVGVRGPDAMGRAIQAPVCAAAMETTSAPAGAGKTATKPAGCGKDLMKR